MICLITGVTFAVIIFFAIRSGHIQFGRYANNVTSVQDEPVQFWIFVAIEGLLSGICLYCAFAKGKQ
jgi:uncharacterized membrane protein